VSGSVSGCDFAVVVARGQEANYKLFMMDDQQLGGIETTLTRYFFTLINTENAIFLVDIPAFSRAPMPLSCVVDGDQANIKQS
jgi:hypothetical protein